MKSEFDKTELEKELKELWPDATVMRDGCLALLKEISHLESENKKQSYIIDMGLKDLQTIRQLKQHLNLAVEALDDINSYDDKTDFDEFALSVARDTLIKIKGKP